MSLHWRVYFCRDMVSFRWAPIMTEKLHSTGQQLYARTSMLFDKYMNRNNSSLKGTSPSNNDVVSLASV